MHSLSAAGLLLGLAQLSTAAPQRGLAYNDASLAELFAGFPSVTWGYNWGYPATGLNRKWEFVPMLYGDPTGNTQWQQEWASNVTSAVANGTTHLLAFNEPDINNLSPAQAASAYMTYMQPHSNVAKLGGPAVTNGGGATGLAWLEQFIGNCTQCTIDFVPIHWYNNWDQVSDFVSHVQQAHAAGGNRPLWITEFEGEGSDDQQVEFIQTVLPWLDSLDYVQRYAYFGVFTNLLVNSAGTALSGSGTAFGSTSGVNSTAPTVDV